MGSCRTRVELGVACLLVLVLAALLLLGPATAHQTDEQCEKEIAELVDSCFDTEDFSIKDECCSKFSSVQPDCLFFLKNEMEEVEVGGSVLFGQIVASRLAYFCDGPRSPLDFC